jgi:membrane protein YfhO
MKRHQFALLFIALIVVIVFIAPVLRKEVFSFRDHTDYFQPLRYFTQIHIRSFVLPHWNSYSASGEPWVANPQTGVFYPPTWLFIILPFETAYMLYLALHLLILGWGAYLLFSRTASEGAALVGAIALTFAGPTLSILDVANTLATFSWVPLVIWCALTRAPVKIAAPVVAMAFLGGEPFAAAIAALAYAVLVRSWRHIVLTGIAAFGLSAIQLLPFLEMVRGSDRAAGWTREQIFAESMAPVDWLRVAIPPNLTAAGYDDKLSQHFIPMVYVGVLVVSMAIVGLIARRRQSIGWLVVLILTIIVAAGNRLPLGDFFANWPVTPFRYPSRVIPFGAMAIVALCVIGWDHLRPRHRWVDLVFIALILVDVIPRARPLLITEPFRTDRVPYPPAIGRAAKIIRMNANPVQDRAAWIAGYLNLYQRRFDASTAAPVAKASYMRLHDAALTRGRRDLINRLGVGYVLSEQPVEPLVPIARRGVVTVYANTLAPPMGMIWTRAQRFSSPEKAALSALPDWSLAVFGDLDPRFENAPQSITSVAFLSLDTHHARVVAEAPADGILLVTQQDAPGWRVFVDGKERRKLLAFGVFRAVEVSRGRHEVIWRYRPLSMYVGAVITIISLLSLQLGNFVKSSREKFFRRRRKRE